MTKSQRVTQGNRLVDMESLYLMALHREQRITILWLNCVDIALFRFSRWVFHFRGFERRK